jgi:hypothetical protein
LRACAINACTRSANRSHAACHHLRKTHPPEQAAQVTYSLSMQRMTSME